MKKRFRKLALCMSAVAAIAGFGMSGCGESGQGNGQVAENQTEETVTLNIAYQYGLAYAPLMIAQEQGLIEEAYEEATGKKVSVVWNQMNSGPDINTGISSGSIDVGFMGVAPAITGVTKGVGYKIFTGLSGQEHGLMTNNPEITALEDIIGSENQIALVNIGSIQHIILAKTLSELGYDPHALDPNIVAMKHPDGMTALETGNVSCHLTTNPYIYKERGEENLHELSDVANTWNKENSFIVGVASEQLYNENQDLYVAVCEAVEEAVTYMNDNVAEAAEITCEYNGNSVEEEIDYLKAGKYTIETKGVFELASFMAEAGFTEEAPASYSDLVFDNVKGD